MVLGFKPVYRKYRWVYIMKKANQAVSFFRGKFYSIHIVYYVEMLIFRGFQRNSQYIGGLNRSGHYI